MSPKKIWLVFCLLIAICSFPALSQVHTDNEILRWEFPENMTTSYPYYLCGYDLDGAPVWIAEVGKWDVEPVIKAHNEEGGGKMFEMYMRQVFTRGVLSGNMTGAETGAVGILDMDGFDAKQALSAQAVLIWLQVFRLFQETARKGKLKNGIIVNANFLFEQLFNLAKPILGDISKDVEIYGTNPDKWRPRLLKQIPQDQLPEYYGGLKTFKPLKTFG